MCLLLDIEHLSIKCCNKSCNNTIHNSWIHTTTLHYIRFHGAVMPMVTPSAMLSAAGSQCHGGASLPGWECSAVAVWCWHLVWQQQLYIMELALANIVLVAATVCMWVKLATVLLISAWCVSVRLILSVCMEMRTADSGWENGKYLPRVWMDRN